MRVSMMLAAVVALLVCASGCSSTRVPYTAGERRALVHAIVGQSLDVVTTDMALSSSESAEGNPIWWNPEDAGGMLAAKLAIMGAAYLVCEWQPSWRGWVWPSLGIAGYGAAAWNSWQMMDKGINPWE
jgi:hypothetical protein